jgi:hypothetical protein
MVNKRNVDRWLVVSVFLLAMAGTARGQIIYVDTDANGANDGSSWADAYNHLQDALAAAGSGDEVRVAEGIYTPDCNSADPNGSGDRETTFQLISGVAIKGGYAGFSEPDPNERHPNLYETVLSGDLDGNDVDVNDPADLLDEPTRGENSYHVITGSGTDETAVLDGFTIMGGNANGAGVDAYGGGICSFDGGSPTVANCTLSGNSSGECGGGMANYNNCSPTLTNCTFSGNSAGYAGAGMCNELSDPQVRQCRFVNNRAVGIGGGMQNRVSWPTVTNCTFTGNTAYGGGGVTCDYGGSVMTNCVFTGNIASWTGSAICNIGWGPVLVNCTFSGNWSASAEADSSCVYNALGGNLTASNCIFWGNIPIEILDDFGGQSLITYTDVRGGWPGVGNIDVDPCFVDAGYWADGNDPNIVVEPNDSNAVWIDGDYHLLPGSPCIDSGNDAALPADTYDLDGDGNTAEPIPFDLDGNARIVDGNNDGNAVVDMGAYEYFVPPVEVAMKFTPHALNPGSKGKWVKAHLVLPEEYAAEDVDVNSPAKITEPFEPDVDSNYVNVFVNDDNLVEVEAVFERSVFCEADISDETIEVMVIGSFTSGQQFFGTDTIKVTTNYFKHLGVLASYWLEAECDKPDWCEGADLDQDSGVDFVDLALYDGCCIEVVP